MPDGLTSLDSITSIVLAIVATLLAALPVLLLLSWIARTVLPFKDGFWFPSSKRAEDTGVEESDVDLAKNLSPITAFLSSAAMWMIFAGLGYWAIYLGVFEDFDIGLESLGIAGQIIALGFAITLALGVVITVLVLLASVIAKILWEHFLTKVFLTTFGFGGIFSILMALVIGVDLVS